MRVLVADDDADIRFVVGSILRRHGWQVTTAESGAGAIAALAAIGAEPGYDAVVLDQNMPPGSGLEVVAWLRAAGDATPAVLFTGFASTLAHASAADQGVTVLDKVAIKQLPGLLARLAPPVQ